MTLADAVGVYNHGYYHFGPKKKYEYLGILLALQEIPENKSAATGK